MKKGILCILAVFAMSIGNWSYAQFPTIGDDVLSGLNPVGGGSGSGSNCTKTQTVHTQFGGAIRLKVSATLSSNGTIITNPYILLKSSCNSNGFKIVDYFSTGVENGSSYNPCGGYTTYNTWGYRAHCFGVIQYSTGGRSLYWNFSSGSCSLC